MNQKIIQHIIQLHQKYTRKLDQQLSFHGISLSEFQILKALQAAPEQTMRRVDLANQVGLTASGITRLLAPMEKIKLVSKQANPRDARVSLIRLTKAGGTIFRDAQTTVDNVCQDINLRMSKQQQQKLSTLLESLL